MSQSSKPRPSYTVVRDATPDDLRGRYLENEWGVFRGITDVARKNIAKHAKLCQVTPGYVMYEYGIPCDPLTMHIILEGRFRVRHRHSHEPDTMIFHDYFGPGGVFGEVEALCKDLKMDLRNGEAPQSDITRAEITCVEPSLVLRITPVDDLLADSDVLLNLARRISYKLLVIGAYYDRRSEPRIEVIDYPHEL